MLRLLTMATGTRGQPRGEGPEPVGVEQVAVHDAHPPAPQLAGDARHLEQGVRPHQRVGGVAQLGVEDGHAERAHLVEEGRRILARPWSGSRAGARSAGDRAAPARGSGGSAPPRSTCGESRRRRASASRRLRWLGRRAAIDLGQDAGACRGSAGCRTPSTPRRRARPRGAGCRLVRVARTSHRRPTWGSRRGLPERPVEIARGQPEQDQVARPATGSRPRRAARTYALCAAVAMPLCSKVIQRKLPMPTPMMGFWTARARPAPRMASRPASPRATDLGCVIRRRRRTDQDAPRA